MRLSRLRALVRADTDLLHSIIGGSKMALPGALCIKEVIGLAVCCLTSLVTVGVPLFQFFLVFELNKAFMHLVIVTGSSALLAGCLGLASATSKGPLLPALHVVTAVLLAALMGGFNTQNFLDLSMMCGMAQSAAAGCASCSCAQSSSCTMAQLATQPGCQGCKALGADFCSRSNKWQVLLLPYTGVIEAVFLAAPAVISLMLLIRLSAVCSVDLEAGKGLATFSPWAEHSDDWPMIGLTAPMSCNNSLGIVHQGRPDTSTTQTSLSSKTRANAANRSPSKQLIPAGQWPESSCFYDTRAGGTSSLPGYGAQCLCDFGDPNIFGSTAAGETAGEQLLALKAKQKKKKKKSHGGV